MRRTVYRLERGKHQHTYHYSKLLMLDGLSSSDIVSGIRMGVSVSQEEITENPGQFPILVMTDSPGIAILEDESIKGDLIAMLELKRNVRYKDLQNASIEQLLALCVTYDSCAG